MNKTKSNSTNGTLLAEHRQDGMYEFSVNGTQGLQKSFKYGAINLKRSRVRKNENSSEFLLVWEQNYTRDASKKGGAAAATPAQGNGSDLNSSKGVISDAQLLPNGTVPKGKKIDDTKFN